MLTSSHADVGKSDSPSEELAARPSSGNEPAAMACSDEAFSANKCIEEQGSSAELSPPSEPVPLSFVPFIGSGQRLGGSSSEAVIAPILDVLLSNLTTTLLNSKGSSQAKCSQEKLKEPKEVVVWFALQYFVGKGFSLLFLKRLRRLASIQNFHLHCSTAAALNIYEG